MKWFATAAILALWAAYTARKDRKPVPRWYCPAINALYAALLVAVILWIT